LLRVVTQSTTPIDDSAAAQHRTAAGSDVEPLCGCGGRVCGLWCRCLVFPTS